MFLLPVLENVCLFTASAAGTSLVNKLAKPSFNETHKALVLSLKSGGTVSQRTYTNSREPLFLQIRYMQDVQRGRAVLPAEKNPEVFNNKEQNFNNFAWQYKRMCYPSAWF